MTRVIVDCNNPFGGDPVFITHAEQKIPKEELKDGTKIIVYEPGGGDFEAILRYDETWKWLADMVKDAYGIEHLCIEADTRLSQTELREALSSVGIMDTHEEMDGISGKSPSTGLEFKAWWDVKEIGIINKEDYTEYCPVDWNVGTRINFKVTRKNEKDCNKQVAAFIERLAALSQASFILSAEYSSVCAIRDAKGLRYIDNHNHFGKYATAAE